MENEITQHISNTRAYLLGLIFTLKSMPTVETKAEVKESSAYLKRKLVLPTELLPMIRSLNM